MTPIEWAMLIMMLISLIMSLTMQPKVAKPKPAAFDEFEFPQFEEGTPQHVFFGDNWTEDWMVLGIGDYRTRPIRTKSGK